MRLVKSLLYPIVIIVLIIFYLNGYAKYLETHVFWPHKELEKTPEEFRLDYEDVFLEKEDGKVLHGWFLPDNNARYTLLFCHGNAGNISDRLHRLKILKKLGTNILIFDYSGFGNSDGEPSEKRVYEDATIAYKYLTDVKGINPSNIIAYGVSIGTSVAINLCSRVPCSGIILEEGFSSGRDVARHYHPVMPYYIFVNAYDSLAKIKKVKIPKLFFHSLDDKTIPLYMGKKLYDAAPEPKEFIEINGDHNNTFFKSQNTYIDAMREFIEDLNK
jgi:fermentation-respiration switch protein FrsA (DUF1100 family)